MATPTIKLESSDGKIFTVDLEVAKLSFIVSNMLDHCEEPKEGEEEHPVHLEVIGNVLEKVIKWCERNYPKGKKIDGNENEDKQLDEWNAQFLDVENHVLHAIIRAADYLDINDLLVMCCGKVADQIKGKNSLEIRKVFGLTNGAKGGPNDGIN